MTNETKNVLITGGAGFIGGALVRKLLTDSDYKVFNFDKLINRSDLSSINNLVALKNKDFNKRYDFFHADLLEIDQIKEAFKKSDPDLVFHLAAETHVDRSIDSPRDFLSNNILGTFNLLEVAKNHFNKLKEGRRKNFRFHHISTDEVFGSLDSLGRFTENSTYDPRSPYSATKASSDHLVNAWHCTYGLPVIITNCSNNYGPWQFPDKLIPLVILKSLCSENIPVYGNGLQIRDWIHVDDHVEGILLAARFGKVGKKYLIGGNNERTNIDLVKMICNYLDKVKPQKDSYKRLIKYVSDRPGHDFRYSIDSSLIRNELGWTEKKQFKEALNQTIDWYLNNLNWCKKMSEKAKYNGERIGLI